MARFILIISIFIFIYLPSFSQPLTKNEIKNKMTGSWRLEYVNPGPLDSNSIVKARIYKLRKNNGVELGIWKNGDTTTQKVSWKFLEKDKNGNFEIIFKGGLWLHDQSFIIKKMTKDRIMMLSCDKHECEEAY